MFLSDEPFKTVSFLNQPIVTEGDIFENEEDKAFYNGKLDSTSKVDFGNLCVQNVIVAEGRTIQKLSELKKLIGIDVNYLQEYSNSLPEESKLTITTNIEKIRWNGSERQLIYLFDLLFKEDLLSAQEYHDKRFSLISTHFKNKKGYDIKPKQLSTTASEMSKGKPNKKDAEKIESIINKIKEGD